MQKVRVADMNADRKLSVEAVALRSRRPNVSTTSAQHARVGTTALTSPEGAPPNLDRPLSPHVRSSAEAGPTAAKTAVPSFRTPAGFGAHAWDFASSLPADLHGSHPRGALAHRGRRRHHADQFVPLSHKPKPSRAAEKPPPPLSARHPANRWGFSAGAYMSDHQPRPSYLGLSVQGIQDGGSSPAVQEKDEFDEVGPPVCAARNNPIV